MDGELYPPDVAVPVVPIRVLFLSMDAHLAEPAQDAERKLRAALPGVKVTFHAAIEWESPGEKRDRVLSSIARADIIVAAMLFLEEQILPIMPALRARTEQCDAMLCALSAPDLVKLTRLGKFRMDKPQSGPMALLKKLRGGAGKGRQGEKEAKMLRRLPQILRFIPGTAQDVRAYFLSLQYWLGGSSDNVRNLVAMLIDRYAAGPRSVARGVLRVEPPVVYPETGLYHPRMSPRVSDDVAQLPVVSEDAPRVGLLIMRSYVLSDDTAHYDSVIEALEQRGLNVVPAFASGLDAEPAISAFFRDGHQPTVDTVISLTGFSLIGGPAYNNSDRAAEILSELDVPYIAAHALEFQSLSQWGASSQGLSPVEATMMIAMPELDGAAAPTVFGGRLDTETQECTGCAQHCTFPRESGRKMIGCPDRVEALASRAEKMIRLRRKSKADKKVAVVLFNFPPNAGAAGTAASLSVFESLYNLLGGMAAEGYTVDLPASVDDLRTQVIEGNAARYGADANVFDRIELTKHVRNESRLDDIEAQWGGAPGRQQTDGSTLHVLGAGFGNVFVGLQPGFGYEGDPMRLLFEAGFAPTHAFSAFYRYLRDDYGADAVVHFGTHGALEFMPGKQTALGADCWPSYLIGDLPNIYFYAANNPSEATIAKRRSAATVVSYLTAPLTQAGLYRSLADLKSTVDRWRSTVLDEKHQRQSLALLAQAQAASLELADVEPAWDTDTEEQMGQLLSRLREFEEALIPDGLHIAGVAHDRSARLDNLRAMASEHPSGKLPDAVLEAISDGQSPDWVAVRFKLTHQTEFLHELARVNDCLQRDSEIPALLRALDGRYIAPVAGGDLISNSAIVPTGRNIHGFDPFRMPSAFALKDGRAQAQRLLDRHRQEEGAMPETVAFVLWGSDNIKSEGAQVAQVLALMGAEPRFDHYGRLTGATLLPLETLGRPRIDVMSTLSGIFRDLLPMQTRLLAEAAYLAAQADEAPEDNFVRKHALAYQAEHRCDLRTAALRVFSNADGAYGSNVNQMIDAGCWTDEDDLAEAYTNRKCFAYGTDGKPAKQSDLLNSILGSVDLAYQNLESVELAVTSIDHYFDTLGGIGRAVKRKRGTDAPVYIGDQTRGTGSVRTLKEQVALESRTRTLNPKWYESMLKHGHEGVRQIEAQVTHTLGWSATTGDVAPWVYKEIADTFILDTDLRERLAALNPKSCVRIADRLMEASQRHYWAPDPETLEALQMTADDLEDRLEGIFSSEGAPA